MEQIEAIPERLRQVARTQRERRRAVGDEGALAVGIEESEDGRRPPPARADHRHALAPQIVGEPRAPRVRAHRAHTGRPRPEPCRPDRDIRRRPTGQETNAAPCIRPTRQRLPRRRPNVDRDVTNRCQSKRDFSIIRHIL